MGKSQLNTQLNESASGNMQTQRVNMNSDKKEYLQDKSTYQGYQIEAHGELDHSDCESSSTK